METTSGDGARVAYPLFQVEDSGSSPTSPLQFEICFLPVDRAEELNMQWHSRLPELRSRRGHTTCFGALYEGKWYACAIWADPVARMFNHKNYLELRRMAICKDAPKNTASRMISIMTKMIQEKYPEIVKLISYQDTAVHTGTIYKASGWKAEGFRKAGEWDTNKRPYKSHVKSQATGDKVRWEKDLKHG